MQNLKVSLLQLDLKWEDKSANFKQIDAFLSGLGQSNLVVLPEMFTTGFTMDSSSLAEPMEGNTLKWMQKWASELEVLLIGSFIVEENGFFNRLLAVKPDGSFDYYDKKHLFRMGKEQEHYDSGNRNITIDYLGWKIKPFICYDLRFPVWCRNTTQAELMLFVANWPERRKEHWRSLLVARAIENMAFVIGVNRVGEDGNGIAHSGNSMLVNARGERLIELEDKSGVLQYTLSKEDLQQYRLSFPAHLDADSFEIK